MITATSVRFIKEDDPNFCQKHCDWLYIFICALYYLIIEAEVKGTDGLRNWTPTSDSHEGEG